jgi:hypothetical protein
LVEEIIAQYLEDQDVGTYNEAGANIIIGPMKPPSQYVPVESIWIISTGGAAPDHVFGGMYTIQKPTVQILVRGSPNDYKGSKGLAQSVYDALNGAEPEGVWPILPMQSEPVWVGPDESNRPIWSINLLIRFKRTAS